MVIGRPRHYRHVVDCFLCDPDPNLVYARSDSFFAMAGWGPIGDGYSLIGAREHLPSMMDLSAEEAAELEEFTAELRRRLDPLFGAATITEHGRIAACLEAGVGEHEPHCLHAHRLVFPGLEEIDVTRIATSLQWRSFVSFLEVHAGFSWEGQYLYAEAAAGDCRVAAAAGPIPRQFFRGVAARLRGEPEMADWRKQPRLDVVEAALARLRGET